MSLLFYAWGEPAFLLVMLFSILVNYLLSFQIAKGKKSIFVLSIGFNLSLLFVFKYADFLIESANFVLEKIGIRLPAANIPLPIGISFFTFQIMSYMIDLYKKEVPLQRSVSKLALYISLFPQLIAGPIVRYQDVEAEISSRSRNLFDLEAGALRFIVGLSKKLLLANSMGGLADQVFSANPSELSLPVAWLGLVAYALQIYLDFSGYSDMAIGIGRILGFKFLENFNYPYFSKSITEFWRRWHISLSSWFRDYLYIPLGGSRGTQSQTFRNLFIVFFLCGLWHGARWTFVVWGLWHGLYLVIERKWGAPRNVLLAHIYTWVIFLFGWVWFRAESLPQAFQFFSALLNVNKLHSDYLPVGQILNPQLIFKLGVSFIACLPLIPWLGQRWSESFIRSAFVYGVAILILVLSLGSVATTTFDPFIYFRF